MQFPEIFGYKILKELEMIKMKLVLLRHGESEWNRLNLFTGWTDVILSNKGKVLRGGSLDSKLTLAIRN